MRRSLCIGLIGLLFGLTACRPEALPPDQTAPQEQGRTSVRPEPTHQAVTVEPATPADTEEVSMTPWPTAPAPADPGAQALVDQARQDLAQRLGVSRDAIGLVSFESVVWPDGGLGCPSPDVAYTQVQVEGYRIVLGHGKRVFAYHGGAGRAPFLCDNPAPGGAPAPPPGFNQ